MIVHRDPLTLPPDARMTSRVLGFGLVLLILVLGTELRSPHLHSRCFTGEPSPQPLPKVYCHHRVLGSVLFISETGSRVEPETGLFALCVNT